MMNKRTIEVLSEIRSNYNLFDEQEEPFYHALSMAIEALTHFNSIKTELNDELSCSEEPNRLDLISRSDAIMALVFSDDTGDMTCGQMAKVLDVIKAVPSAQQIGWVHRDEIYRLISGHSNYHGDNILAALTCLAEGKDVPNPIDVLEPPERKKGEWIPYEFGDETWHQCTACGVADKYIDYVKGYDGETRKLVSVRNYCPNCGAEMRGEEE